MQIICLFSRAFRCRLGAFLSLIFSIQPPCLPALSDRYARFVGPICPLCRWGGECFILKQLSEARGRQLYGETIIRVLSGRLNVAFIYRVSIVYLSYIYRKNTVVVGVRIAGG